MLEPGQIVERYRVELTLGEGGAATVYRVRHTTLGTLHALKLLHVTHPTMRARLIEEGRIQARLRHPHIVAVSDVLEVQGAPALLMEFVGGGSLADRLRMGPLPLLEALQLFRGVVAGVAHAHGAGLVHRDLKPANVLLAPPEDEGGAATPKVTDFGIARLLGDSPGHTRTGVGMGTPAYMAPEQAGDARGIDARADMFSLGVMLYELVTGERPFGGAGPLAPILAARAEQYTPPTAHVPDLPPAVVSAIQACLRADREARLESCEALLAVLDGVASIEARPAPRPTEAEESQGPVAATQTIDEFLPFTIAPPTEGEVEADSPATLTAPAPREAPGTDPAPVRPAGAAAPPPSDPAPGPTLAPPVPSDVRSRTVTALVVDETGAGHAVEVVVALSEGDGGVWAPAGVERDAQVAAQLAVAVALGAEARRWSVRWRVRGAAGDLHGTSIGLAIAIATRAARLDRPVPEGWAFTGGIDLDERVASVRGLPAKVRAAAAAGCTRVALPAAERAGLASPAGVRLVPVADFGRFSDRLFADRTPAARRALRWWPLALLLLPVLAAFTELTSPLETAVQHPVLRATRGELPIDDVVILGVDVPDPRALRPDHPATLRALCAAGASGVVFDLALSTPTEHDGAIAEAISEVRAAGCPVVVPVRFHWGAPVEPGTRALADAAMLGLVESKKDLVLGQVRAAPARRLDASGRSWWHVATLAAAIRMRPESPATPELAGDTLQIGALRNPTWAGLLFPPPAAPATVIPYGARERFGEVADKVVLVGAWGGSTDIHRTPDGPAYGVEILAALTQALLRQATLRSLPPEASALAALVAGLGTAWLATLLPRRRRIAALVVPAAVVAVGLALAVAGVLFAFLPATLAALLGYWAGARAGPTGPRPL